MNENQNKFTCNDQCFDTFEEMISYARRQLNWMSDGEFRAQIGKMLFVEENYSKPYEASMNTVLDWFGIPQNLSLKERLAFYQLENPHD